jgi:tight adherence protein B
MTGLLPAALAGSAVWLAVPAASGLGLARLDSGRPLARRLPAPPVAVPCTAGILLLLISGGPVAAAVGMVAVAVALRLRGEAAHGRRLTRQRQSMILLCEGLAAELRSGRPALDALAAAGSGVDEFRETVGQVVVRGRLGGDVGRALREVATCPGPLADLACCWQVTGSTGAGLAAGVESLVAGLRVAESTRGEVSVALSGPRATARLLAGLPFLGLLLGAGLGLSPVHVLLHTGAGSACLLLGLLADLLGLLWTDRLARGVERAA